MTPPVTLINAFSVPAAEADEFLHHWRNNARVMAAQPGFLRARMFRAIDDDAAERFVNVADWDSREALDQALAHPDFRASVQHVVDDPNLHVVANPAVYGVAVDVGPGDAP